MIVLVLGGARSGKTAFAQTLAEKSGKTLFYLATGQAQDEDMRQRIVAHQQQRSPELWQTIEEPVNIAATLRQYNEPGHCILLDCLTLWQTNIMMTADGLDGLSRHVEELQTVLAESVADIILVSNEINMGLVAMDPQTRRFCDEAGKLHQQIAASSHQVFLIAAGLPIRLKPNAFSM